MYIQDEYQCIYVQRQTKAQGLQFYTTFAALEVLNSSASSLACWSTNMHAQLRSGVGVSKNRSYVHSTKKEAAAAIMS